jgi:hypothetical protein
VFDVLAEDDPDTVNVAYSKFTNSVGLICRPRSDFGAPSNQFFVIGVNVFDPLEEMDAAWASIISDKVNRRVVTPHNGVSFVAEVPGKTQDIAIECRCGFDVLDMEYRGTLNKLCGIRRWKCRHWVLNNRLELPFWCCHSSRMTVRPFVAV